jgi:hypothetical protein
MFQRNSDKVDASGDSGLGKTRSEAGPMHPTIPPLGTPAHPEFTLHLTAYPESIRLPRKLTEWALESWGLAHAAGKAALITCELTTNATRETPGAQIWARVTLQDDGVLLQCWDGSPKIPEPPTLSDIGSERGRGLWIVDALSLKFGVEETPAMGGKVVWSLISREPEEASI